jgi:hypothetical protein
MITVTCVAVYVLRRNDLLKDEDALEIELHVLLSMEELRLSGRVDVMRNAIGSSLLQLL